MHRRLIEVYRILEESKIEINTLPGKTCTLFESNHSEGMLDDKFLAFSWTTIQCIHPNIPEIEQETLLRIYLSDRLYPFFDMQKIKVKGGIIHCEGSVKQRLPGLYGSTKPFVRLEIKTQ